MAILRDVGLGEAVVATLRRETPKAAAREALGANAEADLMEAMNMVDNTVLLTVNLMVLLNKVQRVVSCARRVKNKDRWKTRRKIYTVWEEERKKT